MAETIGSLVDKLTIVDLKIYHMTAQAMRPDLPPLAKVEAGGRRAVLIEQRESLAAELSDLFRRVAFGLTEANPFPQFKMYNDPQYRTP